MPDVKVKKRVKALDVAAGNPKAARKRKARHPLGQPVGFDESRLSEVSIILVSATTWHENGRRYRAGSRF